jgi:hypothetical protein
MIISASRRTDIPAFYSEWFMNRIKEGYCTVPNPFNAKQVSFVNLRPQYVDAIVFWTRNPKPLLKRLSELDDLGYKYYFQYTLNNYPKIFEAHNPSLEVAIDTFQELSSKIGRNKVIWRYDPIFFNHITPVEFHIENFQKLFSCLKNYTNKIVISIIDVYKKTERRLNRQGINEFFASPEDINMFLKLIVEHAHSNNMKVETCAEPQDYSTLGIEHGKCIDEELLLKEFGIDLKYQKDKSQRLACGCMVSKDIGINNTCLMGCEYCYATMEHNAAVQNRYKHDPFFSSLIRHELPPETKDYIRQFLLAWDSFEQQIEMF